MAANPPTAPADFDTTASSVTAVASHALEDRAAAFDGATAALDTLSSDLDRWARGLPHGIAGFAAEAVAELGREIQASVTSLRDALSTPGDAVLLRRAGDALTSDQRLMRDLQGLRAQRTTPLTAGQDAQDVAAAQRIVGDLSAAYRTAQSSFGALPGDPAPIVPPPPGPPPAGDHTAVPGGPPPPGHFPPQGIGGPARPGSGGTEAFAAPAGGDGVIGGPPGSDRHHHGAAAEHLETLAGSSFGEPSSAHGHPAGSSSGTSSGMSWLPAAVLGGHAAATAHRAAKSASPTRPAAGDTDATTAATAPGVLGAGQRDRVEAPPVEDETAPTGVLGAAASGASWGPSSALGSTARRSPRSRPGTDGKGSAAQAAGAVGEIGAEAGHPSAAASVTSTAAPDPEASFSDHRGPSVPAFSSAALGGGTNVPATEPPGAAGVGPAPTGGQPCMPPMSGATGAGAPGQGAGRERSTSIDADPAAWGPDDGAPPVLGRAPRT